MRSNMATKTKLKSVKKDEHPERESDIKQYATDVMVCREVAREVASAFRPTRPWQPAASGLPTCRRFSLRGKICPLSIARRSQ